VLIRASRRELKYRPGALRPFRKAINEFASAAKETLAPPGDPPPPA
jgi:hypothetical protein